MDIFPKGGEACILAFDILQGLQSHKLSIQWPRNFKYAQFEAAYTPGWLF
jgi:hypothetical protein